MKPVLSWLVERRTVHAVTTSGTVHCQCDLSHGPMATLQHQFDFLKWLSQCTIKNTDSVGNSCLSSCNNSAFHRNWFHTRTHFAWWECWFRPTQKTVKTVGTSHVWPECSSLGWRSLLVVVANILVQTSRRLKWDVNSNWTWVSLSSINKQHPLKSGKMIHARCFNNSFDPSKVQ
jgi:hypothetical protein